MKKALKVELINDEGKDYYIIQRYGSQSDTIEDAGWMYYEEDDLYYIPVTRVKALNKLKKLTKVEVEGSEPEKDNKIGKIFKRFISLREEEENIKKELKDLRLQLGKLIHKLGVRIKKDDGESSYYFHGDYKLYWQLCKGRLEFDEDEAIEIVKKKKLHRRYSDLIYTEERLDDDVWKEAKEELTKRELAKIESRGESYHKLVVTDMTKVRITKGKVMCSGCKSIISKASKFCSECGKKQTKKAA